RATERGGDIADAARHKPCDAKHRYRYCDDPEGLNEHRPGMEFRQPVGHNAVVRLHRQLPRERSHQERPGGRELINRLKTAALAFGLSPWTCANTSRP